MMTQPAEAAQRRRVAFGAAKPRIAPPVPARSDLVEFRRTASGMGLTLMPWQETAARYLTAMKADGKHLYREVAVMVGRQNGKTTLAKPLITKALRAGLRVLHLADKRELPREMHSVIADALSAEPELFPQRRGKTIWPRYGAGQEEITLANGGRYRIAASGTGGARGWSADILIIDELREMESFEVISSAEPTLLMSPDPLTVYFTNAGTDKSVVLNALRERVGKDVNLAFLEWSADPDKTPGDRVGWAQANPAMGHFPSVLSTLEAAYTRHLLAGTMPIFETEHLCRAVESLLPPVVNLAQWEEARAKVGKPVRPSMAVKVDAEGRRASAVIAWQEEGGIYLRSFAEDVTTPFDVDAFAQALQPLMRRYGIRSPGFDPWTDRDLARHFKDAQAINGPDYEAACERFVRELDGGQLHHDDDGTIGNDLAFTVRRKTPHGWMAVRSTDQRPTTAVEAAIRAVYLATKPQPPAPRVL